MSRTKKGVFVADKVDFHFHCITEVDARYGKLLQYLKSKTKLQQIEMLLQATEAFWMPFAHRYHKDLEAGELEQAVNKAIYQLRVRILNLEESFFAYTAVDFDSPRSDLELTEVDFDFRCQRRAKTKHGKLLLYLKSDKTEFLLEEMVLQPVAAFWMPFAHKYVNSLRPDVLQQSIARAIHQLQMQIFYLEKNFGTSQMGQMNLTQQLIQEHEVPVTRSILASVQSILPPPDENTLPTVTNDGGQWADLEF